MISPPVAVRSSSVKPDPLRIACRLSGVSILVLLWLSLTGAELKSGEMLYPQAVSYRAEGRRLQKVGRLQEAATAFRKSIASHPSYAQAYNDLGVVLEGLGQLAQAEDAYRRALQFDPDLLAAHSNLALLYEKTGRIPEAAPHWTARVKGSPPEDPWALRARGKLIQYNLPVPMPPPEPVKKEPQVNFTHRLKEAKVSDTPRVSDTVLKERKVPDTVLKEAEEETRKAQEQVRQEEQAQRERDRAARLQAEEVAKQQAEGLRRRRAEEQRRVEQVRRQAQQEAIRRAQEKLPPAAAEPIREKAQAKPEALQADRMDAQSIAEDLIREKKKTRLATTRELYQRGVAAMRQLRYEEAATHFQQVLILEPDHTEAKQGLKRAQTALAKAAQTRR